MASAALRPSAIAHTTSDGPRGRGRARIGGLGQQLELRDGTRSLAVAGAQAIRAGIAAANDHHALAGGENGFGSGNGVAFAAPVLLGQKVHREMNALELAA